MNHRMRRGPVWALAIVAASLTLGTGTALAASGGMPGPSDGTFDPAQDTEENHCISPNGIDGNVLFGISEQIVNPWCREVDAGEFWTSAGSFWYMAPTYGPMPAGFVPAGATPLADFLAKFVAIKYVIDPGTPQEETQVFPTGDRLWIGTIPPGLPAVWPGTLSKLRPLSVGEHIAAVYWVMSAMHCDGLAAVITENCLPAGEVPYGRPRQFVVTSGAAQSQP